MLEDYGHTMELRMLGTRLVMTDDPENIKAIQDTQVSESSALDFWRLTDPISSGKSQNPKSNTRFLSIFWVMQYLPVSR